MAIVNGVNYQLSQNYPKEQASPGELGGKVKVLREEYTTTSALALNDEIDGPSLPPGARVLDAQVIIDATMGASGILSLGHRASTDEDGNSLAEDPDAFITAADAGGQAVIAKPVAGQAGIDLKFGSEAQVFAKCTEVQATAGAKVSWHILYVQD